jgi:type IV pilus assembly protein PilY1
MRRIRVERLWAALAGAACLALPAQARAQQTDTNPPVPNVLLLLDNSGSMERMIDGTVPEASGNACNVDPTTGALIPMATAPQPNRWGLLLKALTGTPQNNYNCVSMPRTAGSQFTTEYRIGGVQPYDTGYYLNYHRPVFLDTSTAPPTACVVAPGSLPGAMPGAGVGSTNAGSGNRAAGSGQAATDFPPDGIILRPYAQPNVVTNAASGACSQFASTQYSTYQFQDGAITSSTSLMRFGLMTFDDDPSAAIGVTQGSSPTVLGAGVTDPNSAFFGAFDGMWSYFPGWNTGAACTYTGNPPGCVGTPMAVGARNPAAPPWEGRMMPFPSTNDLATQKTNNQNIGNVILATRPYGATPLAGMFTDAEYYLWNDPSGPEKADELVHCGQRPQYIILLTDGAPNLDLRPDCVGKGTDANPQGTCPFAKPEKVAFDLFQGQGGDHSVTTFVLGFSVSASDGAVSERCSQFVKSGDFTAECAKKLLPTDPNATCCELQNIALQGSNNQTSAFFADTPDDLQNALNAILAKIAANATTRTTPTFSTSTQTPLSDPNTPTTASQEFLASFNPTPGGPWTGDITRVRNQCTFSSGQYTVNPASINPALGDDFAQNLNSHTGPRTFIAFQPDVGTNAKVSPQATIRPYVIPTVNDGLGRYSATQWAGQAPVVIPNISAAALGITQPCSYNSTTTLAPVKPGLTTAACATMTLDYIFGQPSFTANPGDFPFVSRYSTALGDIYHAAPAVVGGPDAPLQDPSYLAFQATAAGTRKQVVYAATNDGLLHAFWADETKLENNELWAMVPPAVMLNLYPSYPSSHGLLLDGSLITKDVTWDRSLSSIGDGTTWHTMLVAGFGGTNRGYYAVDVTNPDPSLLASGQVPNNPPPPGPQFRWQLTTMPATNYQIFGQQPGTPAITSLFMDPGDGNGAREIGVAILPGGTDGAPSSSSACARAAKTTDSQPLDGYAYRTSVRCWGSTLAPKDVVNGRSLSVVRIDTGEILQVFTRLADVQQATGDTLLHANRIRDTPLDSPMTGTPLVYPNLVGSDATRVFVSDADGTIWRFDLSNPDPTQWTGELFLDLYNQTVDNNATAWKDGQPLEVSPTLALDQTGQLVINAGTGVTDTFDATGIDFVYSITEKAQGTTPKLRAFVNWYLGSPLIAPTGTPPAPPSPQLTVPSGGAALLQGERVSGPMTVFDGTLYFSTYAAAPTTSTGQPVTTCPISTARIWGLDFARPADPSCSDVASMSCDRSIGGLPRLQLPPPQPVNSFVADVTPSATDSTLTNVVIPGVSLNETPACATGAAPSADGYVAGATHTGTTNFTPGSYSLTSQVGQKNPNGPGTRTVTTSIAPPNSPTLIDSWAAVIE